MHWSVKAHPLRRGKVTLCLTATAPCQLPALVVVARAGSIMPLTAAQGEIIARVKPQRLDPGAPLKVPLELPHRGPSRLACFPEGGGRSQVRLIGPPAGARRS